MHASCMFVFLEELWELRQQRAAATAVEVEPRQRQPQERRQRGQEQREGTVSPRRERHLRPPFRGESR